MSRAFSYTFPTSSGGDIAAEQTVSSGSVFALNGSLGDATARKVIFNGYSRSISITLTATVRTNVTVRGRQNGTDVSETIRFENGTNTNPSVMAYDEITSVTVDQAVTGASIRAGNMGFFPLIKPDFHPTVLNASFRVFSNANVNVTDSTAVNTVNIFSSFIDRENNGQSFVNQVGDSELQLLTRAANVSGNLLPTQTAANTPVTRVLTLRYSDRPVLNYMIRLRNIPAGNFVRLAFLQVGTP